MHRRFHAAREAGGVNQRITLFEEKLDFREPFAGNVHTRRGTLQEPVALAAYEQLSGHTVHRNIGAEPLGETPDLSWLAASPDGLIDAVDPGEAWRGLRPHSARLSCEARVRVRARACCSGVRAATGRMVEHLAAPGPGLLEIKCPAKGPWQEAPPYYYMPQVTCLCV